MNSQEHLKLNCHSTVTSVAGSSFQNRQSPNTCIVTLTKLFINAESHFLVSTAKNPSLDNTNWDSMKRKFIQQKLALSRSF